MASIAHLKNGEPGPFGSERRSDESNSRSPANQLLSIAILALLAAAAAVLRFHALARKPFWFDECFSVEVARLSWHDFVRLLWWREANMSLYYLLLRAWLHFGSSPFFIRSLSVLFSLAALPAIFWLARELFNRRVALIALSLMSFNAYHVRYAQEARSYSLFVFLATISSAFFVSYLKKASRRRRIGYIIASVLAVYAHLYALLLVAVQWLSLGRLKEIEVISTDLRMAAGLRRAWIGIGIAVLPLLAFVAKTGAGPIRWIPHPSFRIVLDFFEHLAGNGGIALLLMYSAACVAAVLPWRCQLLARRSTFVVWRLQFLLIWLLFPVVLTLLLSMARPVFLARYFIFCLPPLIILGAAGLASFQKAWMLAVCLGTMLLLSWQGVASYYGRDFDLDRDGSEAAADYIYDHAQPGDAILFHIAEGRIPYEFFVSLRAARDFGNAHLSQPEIVFPRHGDRLDYRDVTGNPASEVLRSLRGQYARVWVVLMSNGTPGHPDANTLMLKQTLADSFPQIRQMQFPQVGIILYSKP